MREIVIRPSDKQIQFLTASTKHVCYGGARGGGKSWVVRQKARLLANRYKGIKILIVRKSYPELINNHINPLKDDLWGMARYNATEKVFTFKNGSTIKFGYCAADKDLDQYQGAEYDIIFLDEATQLQEDWIKKITACVRGVNDFPKRIYYTCNPGGASHAYIKRLFVTRQFLPAEDPNDYTPLIQAKVTDNRALLESQPDYVKQLQALPPHLREMWLEGSWDVAEGMFFEEWRDRPEHYKDRQWTHVIDPFKVPKSWEVYRSFDWGYHHPFSCGWWAVDYDGVIYRIAELYGVQRSRDGTTLANEGLKWTPDHVFSEIRRMEEEHPLLAGREITGVADPAIWDAETGISFAETAAKHGIFFSKGDHKRIPGWMQCHYRLAFSQEGYPQMYVFSSCKDFIRTIPTLMYDEHHHEDLDSDGEDHAADEWRYFCMSRPIKPVEINAEYEPQYGSDPLDQF